MGKHEKERDGFKSRTGFILACIGSAVGMGNIWRFPYMVSDWGGMTFLIPYILFVILIASTGVIEEMALGRAAKGGPIKAFGVCTEMRTGNKKTGELIGLLPVLGSLALAIGYTVVVGWIFISDTTEIGTVYTRAELAALRQCCDVHGLFLYLDGARLGSALTSPDNDLTLPELAALTHAFTIGGTKNGALFGEALVLTRPMPHFRWHMKQRGAVLAKGRLLGLQFQALLEDGLYFDLARRANELAFRLRDGVAALGYPFPVASPSNQQFPVLPNETVAKLQEMGYEFETDHPVDANHTCIRLVTSWATPETAVEDFLRDLAGC